MQIRLVTALFVLLLAACGDRSPAPIVASASVEGGDLVPVFVATNRERNEEGFFDRERLDSLTYLNSVVSIPPSHEPGDAPSYSKKPNPEKHFALASEDQFESGQAFVNAVRRELAKRPPQHREVTLYVHGFYNGYSDSVFRMAQMHKDFDMNGVPVAFSWPSAAKPVGYAYDRDSALFTRDSLQELIYLLSQSGARNIVVLAHSMGGLLVMETLRQIDLARPGWVASNLDSVVLMSPDISVDVFRLQAESISKLPGHFVVVTSKKDKTLKLSTRVSLDKDRLGLGNNIDELTDLPITFIDITNFSDASTNPHFVAAESPSLVALLASVNNMPGYVASSDATVLSSVLGSTEHIQNAVEIELTPDDDIPLR